MFVALGLPCFRAPSEAEALCAQLCAVGLVHAVWTSDADALIFGATRLYRELKLTSAKKECMMKRCVPLRARAGTSAVAEAPPSPGWTWLTSVPGWE